MNTFKLSLIAATALTLLAGVPAPASAQSDETAYCEALAEQYTRHKRRFFRGFINDILGNNRTPIVVTPEVEAMVHCTNAPEYAIAVLERAMRQAGLKVPPPQQAERK